MFDSSEMWDDLIIILLLFTGKITAALLSKIFLFQIQVKMNVQTCFTLGNACFKRGFWWYWAYFNTMRCNIFRYLSHKDWGRTIHIALKFGKQHCRDVCPNSRKIWRLIPWIRYIARYYYKTSAIELPLGPPLLTCFNNYPSMIKHELHAMNLLIHPQTSTVQLKFVK